MKNFWIFILLGILGLFTFIFLYNYIYPIAAVELNISRDKVISISREFINQLGYSLNNFTPAVIFSRFNEQAIYLQSVLGIKKTNELIKKDNFLWIWTVRWFRELEKEEFIVGIDPSSGKVVFYFHKILDEAEGANLSQEEARVIAEDFFVKRGFNLNDWIIADISQQKQKNRTDHFFVWEKKEYQIGEATLRTHVGILGDRVGGISSYFKIPEKFIREYQKKLSYGQILSLISNFFTIIIYILCFINLFLLLKRNFFYWRFALYFSLIVGIGHVFEFFNFLPLFWYYYDTTISKVLYFNIHFFSNIITIILTSLMIFVFGSVGHSLSLLKNLDSFPLITSFKNKDFSFKNIQKISLGYLMAFFFLGFVTLFYFLGIKYFKVWIPLGTRYSNILGTYFPFLQPLTVGIGASISEEFIFRLFAISFFKRYFRKDFFAVLIPAIIWAFSHSSYEIFPFYVRGIELTIVGIILGYLFLRFGLEVVIITHYAVDAILVSIPLMLSKVFFYQISGIFVILGVFVPIIFLSLYRSIRSKSI